MQSLHQSSRRPTADLSAYLDNLPEGQRNVRVVGDGEIDGFRVLGLLSATLPQRDVAHVASESAVNQA
jgi:hypothetical protein